METISILVGGGLHINMLPCTWEEKYFLDIFSYVFETSVEPCCCI